MNSILFCGIRGFGSSFRGAESPTDRDSDKLARIFDNLLRNAISYSYPDSPITLYAWEQDGYVKTVVRNLCDQIPKEKQDMIFEKFFRLDSSREAPQGAPA